VTDSWQNRRVLLATSEPAFPIAYGGIQASAHDLLVGLTEVLGVDARLLSAAGPGSFARCLERCDELGITLKQDGRSVRYETASYYAVLAEASAFIEQFDDMIQAFLPDFVIAQAAGWRDVVLRARARGIRVVHWMHGWLGLLGDGPRPAADLLFANSEYTSEQVSHRFGFPSEVFYPPVNPERVQAAQYAGAEGTITMINPHPQKGLDVLLALARQFRGHRFLVVDSWGTAPFIERLLRREPNIHYLPSTPQIGDVYAQTAVLLVPTLVDETFGRVVVEANLNGIPVLASDRGALPRTVGSGGDVVPFDAPLETWGNALERFLDPKEYQQRSAAARSNAERFSFSQAIHRFQRLVSV
jgi:glycosyltransferase involved in cell wall biosynthesis